MNRLYTLCIFMLVHLHTMADSPLTSIFFAEAYAEVPAVMEILEQRKNGISKFELTEAHLRFFDDTRLSLDYKIALVNALGWGESPNLGRMKSHLLKKYKLEASVFDSILIAPIYPGQDFYMPAQQISNSDLVLLAYLQVMHDYFNPIIGFQCAYRAVTQNPKSEASNYVLGFILAQNFMEYNWCEVYTTMISVRDAGVYDKDILHPAAVEIIFSYINLYREACDTPQGVELGEAIPGSTENKYTQQYWKDHPVYQKASTLQQSSKENRVDLVLINDPKDSNGIFQQWIFFDEGTDGTRIEIRVLNKGDVMSVETNLQLEIQEMIDEKLYTSMVVQERIPAISPNSEVTVTMIIPGYWIYDPDADFIIRLDYDNNIQEANEKNNVGEFHEFG